MIGLWSLIVLAAGWVASATKLGPVVHSFNDYHGIHLADVVLAASLTVAGGVGTWLLLLSGRDVRRDGDEVEVYEVDLRRLPAVVAIWTTATVASIWVAFETQVGPELAEYNTRRALRLGDLVFTFVVIVAASWATAVLLRPVRRR